MPGPQFDEILADAQARITAFRAANDAIDDEIETRRNKNFGQQPTDADREAISRLRAQKIANLRATEDLAFVTLTALDNSDEIRRLADRLAAIADDLRQKTGALNAIGAEVRAAGECLDGLNDLAGKLKQLATDKPGKK